MLLLMLTAALGGAGAMCRVLILGCSARCGLKNQWSTLTVNIAACFAGGIAASLNLPPHGLMLCFVGFIGGLGTLSSICSDCISLFYLGKFHVIGSYLLLTALCGLLAAVAGLELGSLVMEAAA